jgi:hypothetical protein
MKRLLCSSTTVNDVTQVSGKINIYKIIAMNMQYDIFLEERRALFAVMNTVTLTVARIRIHHGFNNVFQNDCIYFILKNISNFFPNFLFVKNKKKTASSLLP